MFEQIRANKIRSAALVFVVAVILFTLSYYVFEYYEPGYGYVGIFVGFLIWFILMLVSFYGGPSIYLAVSGAKKIEKVDNPRLFNIVEEMVIASGLPKMPDIYIIDDPIPNAFATGRNPETSAVAVTTGLLRLMNRDELQGVIAHEISHIKNRDVLYMLVVGIMVGAITLIADIFVRGLFFGGRSRSRSSSSGSGQAQIIMFIIALVLIMLSPIVARLVYLSISRKREYLADASGAQITRYPEGLASALEKIEAAIMSAPSRMTRVEKITAPMYIINPLVSRARVRDSLFSTHPATENRVRILRGMGGASFVDYNNAFKQVTNTRSDLIGRRTLAVDTAPQPKRERALEEALSPKELARQSTDTIWRASRYKFMDCSCGLKFKVPPNFAAGGIECPKCGRTLSI